MLDPKGLAEKAFDATRAIGTKFWHELTRDEQRRFAEVLAYQSAATPAGVVSRWSPKVDATERGPFAYMARDVDGLWTRIEDLPPLSSPPVSRDEVIEECARECERQATLYLPGGPSDMKGGMRAAAAALRALKSTPKETNRE